MRANLILAVLALSTCLASARQLIVGESIETHHSVKYGTVHTPYRVAFPENAPRFAVDTETEFDFPHTDHLDPAESLQLTLKFIVPDVSGPPRELLTPPITVWHGDGNELLFLEESTLHYEVEHSHADTFIPEHIPIHYTWVQSGETRPSMAYSFLSIGLFLMAAVIVLKQLRGFMW